LVFEERALVVQTIDLGFGGLDVFRAAAGPQQAELAV